MKQSAEKRSWRERWGLALDGTGGSEERAYDTRLLLKLWRFIRPYRGAFAAAALTLPVGTAFSLAQPYLLKLAIDHFIATGATGGLAWLGLAFLVALLGEALFVYLEYYFAMRVAQYSLADLRVALFAHLQRLPAAFFDRNPVGRLVTRLTTDVDVISEMFAAGAMTLVMDVLTLFGIAAILFWIDARLAVASMALVPVLIWLVNVFRIQARRSYRAIRERIARLNAYLQEALSGMVVIQLFTREERAFAEFEQRNDEHRLSNHSANVYEALLFSLVEAISSVSAALVIWYGGGQVIAGAVALGSLVAVLEYLQKFFIPIRDFSNKYAVLQSAMAAAERIFDLLEHPPAEIAQKAGQKPGQHSGVLGGRVEFEHVWFAYRDEHWVLRDVSFVVEPGERVAFVGPTGSGKSTIIKLLTRFYEPQRGRILVDGIDVRDWDVHALRKQIATVAQDIFVFSGTIADNIAFGRPQATRREVEQIAAVVHLDRFVRGLPRGYDEMLNERGANLSAGQRQLLAYARALLANPRLLVLDEATSSIDPKTEALVENATEKLLAGRTAIVIAHRLATVEQADRVIVVHRGEIREQGSHVELLARGGLYARLYELQRVAEHARPQAADTGTA